MPERAVPATSSGPTSAAVDAVTAEPSAPALGSETHEARNPWDPRRRARILVVVPGVVGAVLLAAQVALPVLAASVIRHRLGRDGVVERVHVSAFPAVELLWGHADTVQVHLKALNMSLDRAGDLAAQAHRVSDAKVTIDTLHVGPLTVHHARARMHDAHLEASAALMTTDLQYALPPQLTMSARRGWAGRLVVRTTADILGAGVGIDAVVSAQDGALVASPAVPILENLVVFTLFSDPRVAVEAISANHRPGGYDVALAARLQKG